MATLAQTNLARAYERLPRLCYGTHPTEPGLILLKRGEVGFWKSDYPSGPMTWDEAADFHNERLGVTRAQRAAMEAGSMFGWHCPAADPASYDARGRPV